MMFVGLGVSGVLPICHALTTYGYEGLDPRMGLSWVLLEGFLYIFGAFLYAVSATPLSSSSRSSKPLGKFCIADTNI